VSSGCRMLFGSFLPCHRAKNYFELNCSWRNNGGTLGNHTKKPCILTRRCTIKPFGRSITGCGLTGSGMEKMTSNSVFTPWLKRLNSANNYFNKTQRLWGLVKTKFSIHQTDYNLFLIYSLNTDSTGPGVMPPSSYLSTIIPCPAASKYSLNPSKSVAFSKPERVLYFFMA